MTQPVFGGWNVVCGLLLVVLIVFFSVFFMHVMYNVLCSAYFVFCVVNYCYSKYSKIFKAIRVCYVVFVEGFVMFGVAVGVSHVVSRVLGMIFGVGCVVCSVGCVM